MTPRTPESPLSVAPALAALALLAPGGQGKAILSISHCAPPCIHLSTGALGHLMGTSSNTLQMNFLIDKH